MTRTLVAFVAIIGAVAATRRSGRAVLLLLAALLPISMGNVHGYQDFRVIEWLPVMLLPLVVLDMLRTPQGLSPRGSGFLWLVVALFACVALINLMRQAGIASSDRRDYWGLAMNLLVMGDVAWLGRWLVRDERMAKLTLWTFVWIAVVVSCARLANYYLGTPLPFLGGVFEYSVQGGLGAAASAARIGGLDEGAMLGLAALGALLHGGRARIASPFLAIFFFIMVVVAGGRTVALAVLLALVLYLVLAKGGRLAIIGATLAAVAAALQIIGALGLSHQITRVTGFAGGLREQDPFRYQAQSDQLQAFFSHPWLGKGIGVLDQPISNQFLADQVKFGGHGAYTSMLANFGVIGGLTLVSLLLVPLVGSVLALRRHPRPDLAGFRMWCMFVALIASMEVVVSLTGWNGYSANGSAASGIYATAGMYLACRYVGLYHQNR